MDMVSWPAMLDWTDGRLSDVYDIPDSRRSDQKGISAGMTQGQAFGRIVGVGWDAVNQELNPWADEMPQTNSEKRYKQDQTQKQYQDLVEQRRQADHAAENAPHPRQRGRARNDLAGLDRQLAEMERTQGMVPDHISGRPGQNSPSSALTAQSIRQSGATPQVKKPAGALPAAPQNSVQPKSAQAASAPSLATASLSQRAAEMHKRTQQNQAVSVGNKSGSAVPKFGDALMPNPAPVLGRTGMPISENPAKRSKEDTQDLITQMPWLTDAIDRSKPIKMIQDKDIPMPKPGQVIRSTDPGGTWLMPNDRKPDEPLEVWQDRERTKLQADLKKMRADRTRFGFPA